MKKNNNRKGFTLVELLAVIVILAVLALVAMPNVTRLMDNARKNSFTTEAMEFAKSAQTAYTNIQLSGTTTSNESLSLVRGVQGTANTNSNNYDYFCISYDQLKKDQYINKSNDSGYGGIIELFIPTSTNTTVTSTITAIYLTNGSYAINGLSLTNLASGDYTSVNGTSAGFYNSGTILTVNGTQKTVTNATSGNLCLKNATDAKNEMDKLKGLTKSQFN